MGYEDVLPLIGGFGRYQRRIHLLLCLPGLVCAFHVLSTVFLQAKPFFRCRLPDELGNTSYSLQFEVKNVELSSCSMLKDGQVVPCEGYIFDHSIYKSTTVSEWNLVCERTYLKTINESLFMFGVMIGSIVLGAFSDRYGRKPVFFTALIAQVVFAIATAFAPDYWTFTICRTLVGLTGAGYLISYVIAMEMFGQNHRLLVGVICNLFCSLGYMLIAGIAYFVSHWRYLQIALALPGMIFLTYWWFIPESARWLVSKGRLEEAIEILQNVAKKNQIKVSSSQLETLLVDDIIKKDASEKKCIILEIFRHSTLRKRTLVLFFVWFVTSGTYYGLSWNTSNLGGDDYVNFAIAGAVEIPGYLFVLFTLNRWGRKIVLCGCMITSGIALLLSSVMPQEPIWITIMLTMIGKLAITACFGTVYIFTTEQFPTVVRNVGLGACSMSARIGSMCAPFINWGGDIWKPLPMVTFGALALIGSGLSLQLPETLNRELPQAISDCEFVPEITSNDVPENKSNEAINSISKNIL